MSESAYQAKVIRQLKKQGYYCLRLLQTTTNGVPDYLIMKKGEEDYFIEFKAKGENADPLQVYRHEELLEKTGKQTVIMIEP